MMHQLALQDAPHDAGLPPVIVAIGGIFIVIAVLTIILLFAGFVLSLISKQAAKSREFRHQERMKALEMGQAIGPSETEKAQTKYLHNVFWICFWIGAAVPIATTSAASGVMMQQNLQGIGIILVIWLCVAAICISSVICATVLMVSSRNWSSKGAKNLSGNGKAV